MLVANKQGLPRIYTESLYQDPEKPHRHKLTRPVELVLSDGQFIHIPVGFVTDFATVPRLLWGIVATSGRHNAATLIHDYLYSIQYENRKFADEEMLFWLRESKVHEIKSQAMYAAVRLRGAKFWGQKQPVASTY